MDRIYAIQDVMEAGDNVDHDDVQDLIKRIISLDAELQKARKTTATWQSKWKKEKNDHEMTAAKLRKASSDLDSLFGGVQNGIRNT